MNVEEERERIMGFALGPINTDERELLLKIFEDLKKYVGKVRDLIEVIILDRGYWGYDFLQKELVDKYHLDYVLLAKKSFLFVKDLYHGYVSKKQPYQGWVNAVVMKKIEKGEEKEII